MTDNKNISIVYIFQWFNGQLETLKVKIILCKESHGSSG